MPSKASYAIELTTKGGATVRQDFGDTATSAEQNADRTVKAFDKVTRAAEKAEQDRVAARQKAEADFQRLIGPAPAAGDAAAAPAAQPASSAPRADMLVEQRRYQVMAQQLAEAVNPAAAAQRVFNSELERASTLMQKGLISARDYDAYLVKLKRDLVDGKTFGPSTASFTQAQAGRLAAAQGIADQVNPVGKLQRDHNTELERAQGLLRSGALSQAQYDAYTVKLKQDLAQATNALHEHSGALGLNRMQYITAQSAVLRFGDSVLAGQSPIRALALEAHKLVEVVSMDDDGVAGGLAKVTRLINPMTVSLAIATVAVIAAGAAGLSYASQLDAMSRAAEGFGRTSQLSGEQLLNLATDNASAGKVSVGVAEEIEAAILHQTRTSAAALAMAILETQAFADAMGVDAKKGAEDLGKALADPARGADELTAKYGYLTQAQVEHIHELMEENRLTEAQGALLDDLKGPLDRAEANISSLTKAWRALKDAMSDTWANIGKSVDHALGQYSQAEKTADLKTGIGIDQYLLQHPEKIGFGTSIDAVKKHLADQQAELAKSDASSNDARSNQLGQQAREISAKYGLDPTVSPKLEELKGQQKTLEDAQRAGQHVDAATLDALNHAIRTFATPDQQRVRIAQATADLRRAAPHSQARVDAAQRLTDARTAGRVETEGAAKDEADARGEAARGHAGNAGASHAATLARQADAMRVATIASLALADAYLTSGAAALKDEAYRKAATDATKKGIDVDAQMARELDLMAAEQVATLAKTIRGAEDETAARMRVLEAVRAGLTPARDMDQQLQQENVLRPLLALAAVAHGDALAKLTAEIARYKEAAASAVAMDRSWAAQQSINAANDNTRAAQLRTTLAGIHDPAERARRTAVANDTAKGWSAGDVARDADAQASTASANQGADSAEWLANTQQQLDLQRQLLSVQLQYASAKDPADQDEIRALQLRQQLLQQHIDLSDQDIDKVLQQQKANKDLSDLLERQKAGYQELRDTGANALDKLTSPDGIRNWGNTWKSVLRDLFTQFEKLALLNPLENTLFGGNRATLGSGGGGLGSLLGSIFSSGKSSVSMGDISSIFGSMDTGAMSSTLSSLGNSLPSVTDLSDLIPAFATGTNSAPGGLSLVGEQGPELVNLPRGAGVLTASETKAAAGGSGGHTIHMPISIDASGADAAAVSRLDATVADLKRNLPTIAVQAVNDATTRRMGSLGSRR